MPHFRKKPVTIEAVQYNGFEMVDDVRTPMFDLSFDGPDWLVEAQAKREIEAGAVYLDDMGRLTIVTLEGRMYASPNDYVIRGVQGEIYPCKPGIFAETYETVDSATPLDHLEQLRAFHGSVLICPDDEEADSVDRQTAVDCVGDWTNWEERRFFGRTIPDALAKAAAAQAEWAKRPAT